MKVTALCGLSRSSGGLYYAVSSLFQALAVNGGDVVVNGPDDPFVAEDRLAWGPVPTVAYRSFGPLRSSWALRGILRGRDPDLVHQHGLWMDDQWAALQWQNKTGRPVVISPHGMLDPWAVQNSAWKKKLVGWLFANKSLQKASCMHALCQSEAESVRVYGLKNPIAVIPNGVELPDFDNSIFNIQRSTHKRKLLFLGRIHPKKGLKELMEAWSMVHEAWGKEWELVVAGWDDGGHLEVLKQQAVEQGLTRRAQEPEGDSSLVSKCAQNHEPRISIHFVGPKFGKEKDALLRSVDAFILPSFSEGLPMSVLEAWSYGLPVIMTPQCNIPLGFELAAAMRIDPEKNSIAEGLRHFFAMSEGDRKAMGLRGRRLVEEQFTWEKIAEDMCNVYKWVLGGGAPPGCVRLD